MRATSADALPPDDHAWAYEVKWDGYRAVASVADGVAAFRSRDGIDLTGSYPELAELGALLGGHRAVLDGEIVALDDAGRPQFNLLQNHARNPGRAHYLVFDLLHLDALDPQHAPGVGTPVPAGLTQRETHLACELIAETNKLIGMDLVEVNPILDGQNKTAALAVEFALSALGRRIWNGYS